MRVSNATISRNSIARIQANLRGVERAREQISSGLRLEKMSQDPTAGSEVVRVSSSMRAIEQYRRNIRLGQSRNNAEERILDQLTAVLTRAQELAISQGSATATADTRLAAKAEIDELLEFAVGVGNTRFGDEYLLGGSRAGERPLRNAAAPDSFSALVDASNAPVNPSGNRAIETGDGIQSIANHNATEVFLDTGALDALRALSTALGANDVAGITTSLDDLRVATDEVQNLIGTVGARANELELRLRSFDDLELDLKAFRSELRDVEVEQAMVELAAKQTQYQAAMQATARVLGMSLANYL